MSYRTPSQGSANTIRAVVRNADMSEEMQQDAVEFASQASERQNTEDDIAAFIKNEFDKKYSPTWLCFVGRNFGSYITHESKHYIFFYFGQVAILLFKPGRSDLKEEDCFDIGSIVNSLGR